MSFRRNVTHEFYKIRPTPNGFGMPRLDQTVSYIIGFWEADRAAFQIMELTDEAQESYLSEDPEGRP